MLGRLLYILCAYTTVAFAAAYVGAALGIAGSRAFRGERGSSPLLVLLATAAGAGFLALLFVTYFGAFDNPVIYHGMELAMGLLVIGMAIATPPVLWANQARLALSAAAAGTFLTVLLTVAMLMAFSGGWQPAAPYVLGTFAPPIIGLLLGWILSWRQDLDAMLDSALLDSTGGARPL